MKEALIIFIKNPVKGKVKTRLAQSIGENKALEIYNDLLEHTRMITENIPQHKFLFYSDFIVEEDEWNNELYRKHRQIQKGDLGLKMQTAFSDVFKQQYEKVIIIGSDCPHMTSDTVTQAFASLNGAEVVIGPASDGGYYLLGLRKLYKELFQIGSWSTSKVFRHTLKAISNLGLSYFILPELSDIDTKEDLAEFHNNLKTN